MADNTLYYGDNLDILRRYIPDESVDLVYLDPPFNSKATYNVLFREKDGSDAAAQIEAFDDFWHWDEAAAAAYFEVVEQSDHWQAAEAMRAFRRLLGNNDMLAYLAMMAPRLIELRRVLKPTGSIYLHCDPTASHYLKVLMDAVFGSRSFGNEIAWCYTAPGNFVSWFPRRHDVILFYTRSRLRDKLHTFNRDDIRIPTEQHSQGKRAWGEDWDPEEQEQQGKIPEDWWRDITPVARLHSERLGYPTQKPVALLRRIIAVSSNPGDLVLDPFCGCGTTVVAAQELDRRWIGIDITHLAINLMRMRLVDTFGDDITRTLQVVGEPTSLSGAQALADEDKFQFEWWALGLVGARPAKGRKGADKGIDGRRYFHDGAKGESKEIILSVKGGGTGVAHVRDLVGVVARERAAIGVLISMQEPTGPMRAEAASAGFYESPLGSHHPRIQLLTIEQLLNGARIDMPRGAADATFKRAPRASRKVAEQGGMFDD